MLKTTKSILFASLIASAVVSLAGMNYATGEEANKLNIIRGVVEHVPEPEIAQLDVLTQQLDQPNITKSDVSSIKEEIRTLTNQMESRIKIDMTAEERSLMKANYEKLNDQLDVDPNFKRLLETEVVGFGTDEQTKGIFITVDPVFANEENYELYFKIFREVIGNDVPIAIEVNERAVPTTCTAGISGDCDPIRGAIKMESQSFSPCSIGFKADLDGAAGFIIAGHCTADSKKIYQPVEDFWGNNRVGVVTQTAWDSDTKCDCAFVDLDSGESAIDDVYLSIDLDSVGTVVYNDAVTIKGYVGTTNTTVKTADYTTTVSGNTLRNHIQLNAAGLIGNSGGPVYDSGSDELYAIQSHNEGNFAIVSNANYLDDEITDASWDFS